ncbi:MAG: RNA polymerase subunit sigma-24 [Planctomycetota bacterium]|nr:MAG: RNA polymerase subunit sigma-24 [Planctomycetota bacterium]
MNERSRHAAEPVPSGSLDLAAALAAHGRWLRTALAARGVEPPALDEVLQEVAAEAARSAERLKDRERIGPWLYRIAVVQALQYRRRTGRRRRLAERYAASGMAPQEATDRDSLAWLLAAETQQLVRRAIARLAPQDAEILLLKYTEDWSYRELAERLGMTTSAIEARLHRARGRLRSALVQVAPDLAPAGR